MPATRDRLQARIEEALANGVPPSRLPGLKPTVDRVLNAVEDQEYAVTMADRDQLFDRIARLENLLELSLRARLLTLAPTSELRAEIEAELGLNAAAQLEEAVDPAGA